MGCVPNCFWGHCPGLQQTFGAIRASPAPWAPTASQPTSSSVAHLSTLESGFMFRDMMLQLPLPQARLLRLERG
eukprot:5334006-Pyramimonas_sp.AAC.1